MSKIKDEYVKMRNKNQFDINWFYKYFLENGGKRIDLQTFYQIFNMGNISETCSFLDKKFNLTVVIDSNGNFKKVVI